MLFCKKNILRNFAKFTGKHLRQSLFFNKVAFSCGFCKFLRTPFAPDIVLLHCGTNYFKKDFTLQKIAANILKLAEKG